MSNDKLDTLRPEVRSALGAIVRADVCRDPVPTDAFDTIRAELLRLAEDAAMFAHAVSLGQRYKQRAEKAEAELAALKSRIAEAPVASVRVDDRMHVSIGARSNAVDFVPLHTKHVALVKVEE